MKTLLVMKQTLFSSIVTLWFVSAVANSLFANPNYLKPEVYLETHGLVPEAVPLSAECIQVFETFRDLVNELDKKVEPKKFAAAFTAQQRFIRLNLRLKQFGEPLSFDLQSRFKEPNGRFYSIRNSFIASPECGIISKKIIDELRKKEKGRAKLVEQLQEMLFKKDWEAAEKLWDKSMTAFWPQLAFLDGQPLAQVALAFYAIEDGFKAARSDARCESFQKVVDEKHLEHKEKLDDFIKTIRSAPGQLASSGRITIGDKSSSGSEALKQFTINFGQRHIDLMQDACLDFLVTSTRLEADYDNSDPPKEHPARINWVKTTESATQELIAAITAIINTETQSSAASTAADYFAYQQSVAFALNRFSSSLSLDEFTPALGMLAKKVGLEKSGSTYGEATKDVLFWRRQIAERMDKLQRETDYPELDVLVRVNLVKNPAAVTNASTSRMGSPAPTMFEPLNKLITTGWANLQGKTTSVGEIARFDSDKELYMARLNYGMYARPTASFHAPEHLRKLMNELLVDESHPALDLRACHAIYESESGEVTNLGGEVAGIHFESSSTRMLKLPPIAGNFLRYSSIQNSVYPKDEMSGLCIRVDLKPKWFSTRYQFVKLP